MKMGAYKLVLNYSSIVFEGVARLRVCMGDVCALGSEVVDTSMFIIMATTVVAFMSINMPPEAFRNVEQLYNYILRVRGGIVSLMNSTQNA